MITAIIILSIIILALIILIASGILRNKRIDDEKWYDSVHDMD